MTAPWRAVAEQAAERARRAVAMRLDQDFHGSSRIHIPGGTTLGSEYLTLTAGQIGSAEEEFFGQSRCHWLAAATSCMTGWDVVGVKLSTEQGWETVHSAVAAPDGSVLDIYGHTPSLDDYATKYRQATGRRVQLRRMRVEEMFHDHLTAADPSLVGDPAWWTRIDRDPTAAGIYQHYARLVLTRAGHEVPAHCRPAPPAHRPERSGHTDPAGTSAYPQTERTPAPSTGGTAMTDINEIRAKLTATGTLAMATQGALAQTSQEMREIAGSLQQATSSSSQPTIQEAMRLYAEVGATAERLLGMVDAARSAVDAYSASL